MEDAVVHLAKRVAALERKGTRACMGQVVSTAPFQVLMHGDSTAIDCRRLGSYTPAVDDMVLMLMIGNGRPVALGVLA